MASNGLKGRGREGSVSRRSQFLNRFLGLWMKRDDTTGRFMDEKTSGGRFKGVRVEKKRALRARKHSVKRKKK